MNGKNIFEQLLRDTLIKAERTHRQQSGPHSQGSIKIETKFSASDFSHNWFRQEGSSFFFLFRKNLKVTNIQFAELLALIRLFNYSNETNERIHDLQFLSMEGFNSALSELVDSFSKTRSPNRRYSLIAEMYYSILSRHVIVEPFFGSCAVFVPPNLRIDLSLICAYSGYIHSCGQNIFTRKIDKASKKAFFGAVDRHLKKSPKSQPPFFMIYAHEDFTKIETPEKKEYLRDGLDQVKIFIEKFYMNSERLIDVAQEMKAKFRGKLLFHDDGQSPSDAIRNARNEARPFDSTRTLWLLVDHSIGKEMQNKGKDLFYICYEQLYVNENPFQFFDENKPAWLTPTTIPHTLLAAMINIGLTSHERGVETIVADPFAGTGTTWLETIKLDSVKARCTDRSPMAQLLAWDNLEFFCMGSKELTELQNHLKELQEYLLQPPALSPKSFPTFGVDVEKHYKSAIKLYDRVVGEEESYTSALELPKNVRMLEKEPYLTHLFFYLILRTVGRSRIALQRRSTAWNNACATQARYLAEQIGLLIDARRREKERFVEKRSHFSIYNSRYSLACTVNLDEIRAFRDRVNRANSDLYVVKRFDVMENENGPGSSLKPQSCDIVITDPPYGFNTDDDLEGLAKLYADVIKKMIQALRDDGQLIICLLDRSHTGRRSPYFTHKELITQQVLSSAGSSTPKRQVIIPAYSVPDMRDLFRPPYYWESQRALRRAILHFRIRTV